jgi:hypothetical protein
VNCFAHRQAAAVGVCKNCGRGVCPDCVKVVEAGIVCSQGCAAEQEQLWELNHRALKLYGIGSPPRRRLSVGLLFLAPAGLIFLVFGVAASILVGYVQLVDAFAMTLGGFLIIVGAWYHAAQRKPDV